MEREFLQEKSLNRLQDNAEKSLDIDLSAKSRLIPYSDAADMLSLNNLYIKERDACENYRMIFTVNPICSNVLHNAITEPVYREGSDSAHSLTMLNIIRGNDKFAEIFPLGTLNQSGETSPTSFDELFITRRSMVMDTEYSHEKIGNFKYHCGYDIFNNHLLRSDDFQHVKMANDRSNEMEFNMIYDYVVDYSGNVVTRIVGESDGPVTGEPTREKIRMYTLDNIKSFSTAYYDGLRNVDGWYGFYNTGNINIPNGELGNGENREEISLNRILNNEPACSFIDMYPDRSLYSFIPKINRYRKRLERNWDCAIVYPYASDTQMFNKVMLGTTSEVAENKAPNAVRVLETKIIYTNVGDILIEMHSMLRHTLQPGDTVRIFYAEGDASSYNEILRFSLPVRVVSVGDTLGNNQNKYFRIKLSDISNFCGIKDDKLCFLNSDGTEGGDILFFYRKIEGGYDDKYYFRKFKPLMNYEYVQCTENEAGNEYVVVSKEPSVINENSNKYIKLGDDYFKLESRPLTYTQNKIAYGENIYGDRIAQVIFNDDICISGLKDNLGRPLSSVYFTAVKTNRGYKNWYEESDAKSDKVEYSHCFGDVTSGLDMSPSENATEYNVRKLYNINKGNVGTILEDAPVGSSVYGTPAPIESGITLEEMNDFYGDIVEFSKVNYTETVIEQVYHRFNTAQRETTNRTYANVYYDELVADQYEVGQVESETPPGPPAPEEGEYDITFQVLGAEIADSVYYKATRTIDNQPVVIAEETVYGVAEWPVRWFKEGDVIEWRVTKTGGQATGYTVVDCNHPDGYTPAGTQITMSGCNVLIQISMEVTPEPPTPTKYRFTFNVLNNLTAATIDYTIDDVPQTQITNITSYTYPTRFEEPKSVSYTAVCTDSEFYYDEQKTVTVSAEQNEISIAFRPDYRLYKLSFSALCGSTMNLITADTISFSAKTSEGVFIDSKEISNVSTWTVDNWEINGEYVLRPGIKIDFVATKANYETASSYDDIVINEVETKLYPRLFKERRTVTFILPGDWRNYSIGTEIHNYLKLGNIGEWTDFTGDGQQPYITQTVEVEYGTVINYTASTSGAFTTKTSGPKEITPGKGNYEFSFSCSTETGSVIAEGSESVIPVEIPLKITTIGGEISIGRFSDGSCTPGNYDFYIKENNKRLAHIYKPQGTYCSNIQTTAFTLSLLEDFGVTPDVIPQQTNAIKTILQNYMNIEGKFLLSPANITVGNNYDVSLSNTIRDEHAGPYEKDVWLYGNEQGSGIELSIGDLYGSVWGFIKHVARTSITINIVDNTYGNTFTGIVTLSDGSESTSISKNITTATTTLTFDNISAESNRITITVNVPDAYPVMFDGRSGSSNTSVTISNETATYFQNKTIEIYCKKTITVTVDNPFKDILVNGSIISCNVLLRRDGTDFAHTTPFLPGTASTHVITVDKQNDDFISSSGWNTSHTIGFTLDYPNDAPQILANYKLQISKDSEPEPLYNGEATGLLVTSGGGKLMTYQQLNDTLWTFTPSN